MSGRGVDVGEVPLVSAQDEEMPHIPYNRSGTQIFGDNNNAAQTESTTDGEKPNGVDLELMWDEYENATPKNFFKNIAIAQDGGFSEVAELVGTMRYITATMLVAFVLMNAYSLISVNLAFIFGDNKEPIFLVTKWLILDTFQLELGSGEQAVIGFLELGLITLYLLRCFYHAFFIWRPTEGKEVYRWQAVQELFWNAMPEASTISAVKTLNFVTPAVLLPALAETLMSCNPFQLAFFIVSRVLAAFVGFDALLYKLQVNASEINRILTMTGGKIDNWGDVGTIMVLCLAFMNQFLGIVQVTWFVKRRIFSFIFAGEDGIMTAEEDALKETWESMLCKRIWKELPWYQAIACYMSYSDYDFQKLALEDVVVGGKKSKRRSARNLKKQSEQEAAASQVELP